MTTGPLLPLLVTHSPIAAGCGVWAVSAPAHTAQRVPATSPGLRWASGSAGGGGKGGGDRAVTTQEDPFSSLTDKCVLTRACADSHLTHT